MYLRKAFDCMALDLLIHKAELYCFSESSNIFLFLLRVLEAINYYKQSPLCLPHFTFLKTTS